MSSGLSIETSFSSIGRTLKKPSSSPIASAEVIPLTANRQRSIAAMQDLLADLHAGRTILIAPLVYLDETSKQLLAETRVPISDDTEDVRQLLRLRCSSATALPTSSRCSRRSRCWSPHQSHRTPYRPVDDDFV